MPEKSPLHLWRESVSSKPSPRDTFKGMHLAVLHQASRQKLDGGLLYIQLKVQDFVLCELKGRPNDMVSFELPSEDEEILWICLQFQGRLTFPNGGTSNADTIFTFSADDLNLTVQHEKVWVLFMGVTGVSKPQLMAEYPKLREYAGKQADRMGMALPITYVERQALDVFSRLTFGPFITQHHIAQLLGKFYTSYIEQLRRYEKGNGKDISLVPLYHKVLAYIHENYMKEGLNREMIANAFNCSPRSISRAFEGRSITVGAAIQKVRLYKGRELLRNNPELTIEQIAVTLYFTDAKHFANQYKKQFNQTPRQDRKNIADWR